MNKVFAGLVVLASCLLGSGAVQATAPALAGSTIDIGVLGSTFSFFGRDVDGSGLFFEDIYNFKVSSSDPYVSVSVTNVPWSSGGSSYYDISGLSMQIFSSADAPQLGQPLSLSGFLGAGDYYAKVSGTTSGLDGGSYEFAAAAVPEAQTWAMVGVGLVLIALRLRRHDKPAIRLESAQAKQGKRI